MKRIVHGTPRDPNSLMSFEFKHISPLELEFVINGLLVLYLFGQGMEKVSEQELLQIYKQPGGGALQRLITFGFTQRAIVDKQGSKINEDFFLRNIKLELRKNLEEIGRILDEVNAPIDPITPWNFEGKDLKKASDKEIKRAINFNPLNPFKDQI